MAHAAPCINSHHRTICELPDFPTVRIEGFSGAVGELYDRYTCLLVGSLDSSIREDTLLFASVGEDAFQGAIGELNLLGTVREMFLNLIVGEFIDLKAVGVGGLRGTSIRIEVEQALAFAMGRWESLLQVTV